MPRDLYAPAAVQVGVEEPGSLGLVAREHGRAPGTRQPGRRRAAFCGRGELRPRRGRRNLGFGRAVASLPDVLLPNALRLDSHDRLMAVRAVCLSPGGGVQVPAGRTQRRAKWHAAPRIVAHRATAPRTRAPIHRRSFSLAATPDATSSSASGLRRCMNANSPAGRVRRPHAGLFVEDEVSG